MPEQNPSGDRPDTVPEAILYGHLVAGPEAQQPAHLDLDGLTVWQQIILHALATSGPRPSSPGELVGAVYGRDARAPANAVHTMLDVVDQLLDKELIDTDWRLTDLGHELDDKLRQRNDNREHDF